MADLYEDFKTKKKKMEDHQETSRRDRRFKKILKSTWRDSPATTTPPATKEYREGWDRIFGGKDDDRGK